MLIHFHLVYSCFYINVITVSSSNRDHMAHKTLNIYNLSLSKKKFANPELSHEWETVLCPREAYNIEIRKAPCQENHHLEIFQVRRSKEEENICWQKLLITQCSGMEPYSNQQWFFNRYKIHWYQNHFLSWGEVKEMIMIKCCQCG